MKNIGSWEIIAYDLDGNRIPLSKVITRGLAQQVDDWITELESEEE